jgi:hypothetical protein
MALNNLPFGVDLLSFDPKLQESLRRAGEHLQWIADSIEQKDNPRVLDKNRGDNLVRSHVRALALVTRALFGTSSYGIIAKTVTVGLGLNPELTRGDTEEWCKKMPSPKIPDA